jgi:hypothetical protein
MTSKTWHYVFRSAVLNRKKPGKNKGWGVKNGRLVSKMSQRSWVEHLQRNYPQKGSDPLKPEEVRPLWGQMSWVEHLLDGRHYLSPHRIVGVAQAHQEPIRVPFAK